MKKNPINIPYRYGLEFEIQMVIKHPNFEGINTLALEEVYDVEALGLPTYEKVIDRKRNQWVLIHNEDRDGLILVLNYSILKGLATLDVQNIEISNEEPAQTIPAALQELNRRVDKLGKIFQKLFRDYFQFAFFLPVISYNEQSGIETTKHLNISYDLNISISKQEYKLEHYMDLLVQDYPHYFSYENETISVIDDIKTLRMHIKLPYGFKQYSKLFAGTANLPTFKEIKKGKTGYSPILLGMTSLHGRHSWMRKAKLV